MSDDISAYGYRGYGRAGLLEKKLCREPVSAQRGQQVGILKQKGGKKDSTGGANVTEKKIQIRKR